MMILRMNQRSILFGSLGRASFALAIILLSGGAAASDFSCLQALIPASDTPWVSTHRSQFSLPKVSSEGTVIAIAQWDQDRLLSVFVYTEKSSRRFDRISVFGAGEQALNTLVPEWLKTHLVAVKSESLEVFQFQLDPPRGWNRKSVPMRTTASVLDLGGWLVEAEKPGDVEAPIKKEIELRENWARNSNLNKERFKAWTKAEKACAQ